ncbi:LOW QUALITY PROTEIN: glucose-6-phosphatase 2 [Sarcophilus harrisii]
MDFLHWNGILMIQHLQKDYWAYHDFLNFMSNVGDSHYIFSVYFPLWFQLNQTVGTKMIIWIVVIGDWFNLIFKWILFGHHPYWVQETQIYTNHSSMTLQFPTTCETGPGCLSGHAMGSSCVWYVMVTATLSYTVGQIDKSSVYLSFHHRLTWSFLWRVFWLIQISVCISRVLIATHFPHQVVLGVIGDVLVAEVFEHTPGIQTASLGTYIKTNIFLFLFALGFYLFLKLLDIDLLWSVPKAKKCANPDWIHIDTTPFAGLVRNLGFLFGLGFAINSGKDSYKLNFKLLCMMTSLTLLQLYNFVKIPTHAEYLFYVLSFCKSASIPLAAVAVIPYCIYVLMRPRGKKIY